MGFFLKYAFDNNWISPALRVLMGLTAGAGLLWYGKVMHARTYKIFSQGIIGAGISILYLSMYASFNYYSLVSQQTAFVGMSVVTAVAIWRGLRHDSIAIGLLGWIGGFLTPYLLRSNVVNDYGFLVYLALFAAGISGISLYRPAWSLLDYLNLGGTTILYTGWFYNYYDQTKATTATVAIVAYWIVFFGSEFLASWRGKAKSEPQRFLSVLVAALTFAALYFALYDGYRHSLAAVVLGIAGLYAAVRLTLSARKSEDSYILSAYTLYAIALLIAATMINFSDYEQVVAVCGECVALAWVSKKWDDRVTRYAVAALVVLVAARLILVPGFAHLGNISSFTLIFNARGLAIVSLIATAIICRRWLVKVEDGFAVPIQIAMSVVWCTAFFGLATVETLDYFRCLAINERALPLQTGFELTRNLTVALAWTFVAAVLLSAAYFVRDRVITLWGLGILVMALAFALGAGMQYDPDKAFSLLFNYRATVWIVIGLVYFVAAKYSSRLQDIFVDRSGKTDVSYIREFLTAGWCFVIFALGTCETLDYFRHLSAIDEFLAVSTSPEQTRLLTLSLVWTITAAALLAVGFFARMRVVLVSGFILVALAFCFALSRGAVFEPARNFALIVNYRTIVTLTVGIVIFAASLLAKTYSKDSASIQIGFGQSAYIGLTGAWCLLLFLLTTYETLDYFRHLAAVSGEPPMAASFQLTKHLMMSLTWTVLSAVLITIGVRARGQVLVVTGFLILALGTIWALAVGWSFSPADNFQLFFNFRAIVLVIVSITLLWTHRLVAQGQDHITWFASVLRVMQVSLWAIGLYFLTVEVWDFFDRTLAISHAGDGLTTERLKSIQNSQQLALSAVWLAYSVIMMTLGIWKRKRPLRLAAFALFGITILKIFLRDLTFLTGLYRILSFIGLGVILLGVSFAYQRFKSLIFGEDAEPDVKSERSSE